MLDNMFGNSKSRKENFGLEFDSTKTLNPKRIISLVLLRNQIQLRSIMYLKHLSQNLLSILLKIQNLLEQVMSLRRLGHNVQLFYILKKNGCLRII